MGITLVLHETYMDKIEIPYTSIYQCLEGGEPNSLYDSRPQQTFIIHSTGTAPRAADDDQDDPQQIQMSFAPYPRRGNEQKPRDAYTT